MNMNAETATVSPVDLMKQHESLFAELAAKYNEAKAKSAAGRDDAKAAKGTITAKLKDYAKQTHETGVPVDAARKALILALGMHEVVAGTIKASGNHFAGFRKMLDEPEEMNGKTFEDATAADAQYINASEETKELKALKKLWADHVSEWKLENWRDFLTERGILKTGEAVTEGEQAAIAHEARKAA